LKNADLPLLDQLLEMALVVAVQGLECFQILLQHMRPKPPYHRKIHSNLIGHSNHSIGHLMCIDTSLLISSKEKLADWAESNLVAHQIRN